MPYRATTRPRFHQQFSRHAAPTLIREFGEPLVYQSRRGWVREVQAIVERDTEVFGGTGDVVVYDMVIRVLDTAAGIRQVEIDTGGDKIAIGLREDEDLQYRAVSRLLSTENGLVRFGCR